MAETLFVKEKQVKILLLLKDQSQEWYISNLAKAAGTTYVHACNLLLNCERLGIITSMKHGKIKSIKLTEKGMTLANSLSSIYGAINEAPTAPQPVQAQAAKPKPEEKKE